MKLKEPIEIIKQKQIIEEEKLYLTNLEKRLLTNKEKMFQLRLRTDDDRVYFCGKTERVKEDNDYHNKKNDKTVWLPDPTIREIDDTVTSLRLNMNILRNMQGKIISRIPRFECDDQDEESEE